MSPNQKRSDRLRVMWPVFRAACDRQRAFDRNVDDVVENLTDKGVTVIPTVIKSIMDLTHDKNGRICAMVRWEGYDLSTTMEHPENIAHCVYTLRAFDDWVNAGCPESTRGKRGSRLHREIGCQPGSSYGRVNKRHCPSPKPFYTQSNPATGCIQKTVENAIASFGLVPDPVYKDEEDVPFEIRTLQDFNTWFDMNKQIKIERKLRIGKSIIKKQDLPPGRVYIGVAVTLSNTKHSVVIDCQSRKCMVLDSTRMGPVPYDNESVAWVKQWMRIYEVVRR